MMRRRDARKNATTQTDVYLQDRQENVHLKTSDVAGLELQELALLTKASKVEPSSPAPGFPKSPTRYGYNSSNTLDFAIISNFNYPYNIVSINDLSSDHNPVMLNFNITTPIHKDNPRAITTCWSAFRKNLKNEIKLFDYAKINNESTLEEKVAKHQHLLGKDTILSSSTNQPTPLRDDVTPPDKCFTPDATPSITMLRRHTAKESTAPCELQRTVKTPH
ncbi:hypothetical protein TNCV_2917211 [Trichonephila clavipes]|nr:hypothetical protein TNCV_2917211 [Trichonephila clavipes]